MPAGDGAGFGWLTAAPIAHRGLHDRRAARPENSLAAAAAAAEAGFAIECDVQRARDGEPIVFHDFTLERMTGVRGSVADHEPGALGRISLFASNERIPTFRQLLSLVDGRVPVICEIKSAFDGDMRLADRVAEIARESRSRLALKSFDPKVVAHLRARFGPAGSVPLGVVAEAHYEDPEWAFLGADEKRRLAALTHFDETQPDFLSYHVADLPHAAVTLFRQGLGRPVMSWTVRTPEQRSSAASWADQMVFEGFSP
jgi:glycerophosphoryl diester phosphodiesterase